MQNRFYVKATGPNRYAGGSCNWLRIRNIKLTKDSWELEVKIKYGIRYLDVSLSMEEHPNLVFKDKFGQRLLFKDIIMGLSPKRINGTSFVKKKNSGIQSDIPSIFRSIV